MVLSEVGLFVLTGSVCRIASGNGDQRGFQFTEALYSLGGFVEVVILV